MGLVKNKKRLDSASIASTSKRFMIPVKQRDFPPFWLTGRNPPWSHRHIFRNAVCPMTKSVVFATTHATATYGFS